MKRLRAIAGSILLAVSVGTQAQQLNEPSVPKPYVIAPECTAEQRSSATTIARTPGTIAACFFLEKWSFRGAALAFVPEEFADRLFSPEEFRLVRRRLHAEQSARLRTHRDLKEALPGEPPAHGSTPLSLFVRSRTPLGVFLNEGNHIGFADLLPVAPHNDQPVRGERYPLLHLETLVYAKGRVYKLVQVSPISGPSTIGEGYRMADDWARRFNGSERLASED